MDMREYTGPTAGGLMYGEHLRFVRPVEGVTPIGGGNVLIGRWAEVEDFTGQRMYVRQAELAPVKGRCVCDACTS